MSFSEFNQILQQLSTYPKIQGKRFISIDYGEKVIGLAIYYDQNTPFPLVYDNFSRSNLKDDKVILHLKQVILTEDIDYVIVGIPYLLDQQSTKRTLIHQSFKQQLQTSIPSHIKVYEQDESLTTFEAKERMLNSPLYNFKVDLSKIDGLSAVIILEDFLKSDKL